jgi:DNA-binding response OmpR family regulator
MVFNKNLYPTVDGNVIDSKVLLIDDDAELLQLATVIFKKEGAQVITALDGMEAGADDFLSKPFNADILLARAKTVLRRSEHLKAPSDQFNYDNGHLSIDVARRDALINNKRIKLTPVEFRLLTYLARNAGKVLTFEQILTNVWGNEYRGSMDYVHVYISHLRRKLGEDTKLRATS